MLLSERTKKDIGWAWVGLRSDLHNWPRRWKWYDRIWWWANARRNPRRGTK